MEVEATRGALGVRATMLLGEVTLHGAVKDATMEGEKALVAAGAPWWVVAAIMAELQELSAVAIIHPIPSIPSKSQNVKIV